MILLEKTGFQHLCKMLFLFGKEGTDMNAQKNLQSTQTIAKLFGVTTRRVEQLKTEGMIQGEGKPTKYDLFPTIQAYIQHSKQKADRKTGDDRQNWSAKLEGEARIKQAKAEVAELQLKE